MPTNNKRINLTVPDALYQKIQVFQEEHGITSIAGACTQLILAQLRTLENSKIMMDAMRKFTPEQLEQINKEGLQSLHDLGFLPKQD